MQHPFCKLAAKVGSCCIEEDAVCWWKYEYQQQKDKYQHVVEITSVGTYVKWWDYQYEHVNEYEVYFIGMTILNLFISQGTTVRNMTLDMFTNMKLSMSMSMSMGMRNLLLGR